jgi:tetratricopeptide (TPR) repeat protein
MYGEVLIHAHRITDASENLESGIVLARESDSVGTLARGLLMQALLAEHSSRYEKGRELIGDALALPVGAPGLSAALHRRAGCIAARSDRFEDGHAHLMSALHLAKQAGNRNQVASVLNNLASLHTVAGQLEEAERWLEKGFLVAQELVHSNPMGWLQSARAFLLYGQGRLEEALSAQGDALEWWVQTGAASSEAYGLLLRSAMHIERGEVEAIRPDLMRIEEIGVQEMGRDSLLMCGLLHQARS